MSGTRAKSKTTPSGDGGSLQPSGPAIADPLGRDPLGGGDLSDPLTAKPRRKKSPPNKISGLISRWETMFKKKEPSTPPPSSSVQPTEEPKIEQPKVEQPTLDASDEEELSKSEDEELEGEPVAPAEEPAVEDPTVKANKEAAKRLELGAKALEGVGQRVTKAGVAFEQKKKDNKEADDSRGFFKKLFGKGKQAKLPPYDHPFVAGKVDDLRTTFVADFRVATRAVASGFDVSGELLPEARSAADVTTSRIKGKVEEHSVNEVSDVGYGIEKGGPDMIKRALARGGIDYGALTIKRKLGQGGSQAVPFLGEYLGMGELGYKSSKLTPENLDGQEDEVHKEATIMKMLPEHENILQSGGSTERLGAAGYTMELAKHGDLARINEAMAGKSEEDMPLEERVLVMKYLSRGGMRGLSKVHERGLVHADVKGENFLLGDDLQPKLMDFGLAEPEEEDKKGSKRVGTASFMAPEVVTEGVQQKSDIWSMGEMLLKGVFSDMNSLEIQEGAKRPSQFNTEILKVKALEDDRWIDDQLDKRTKGLRNQEEFKDFVRQTMHYDPESRASAAECLEHGFLQLTRGDEERAKELLRTLLT